MHPNAEGAAVIADKILPSVKKLLGENLAPRPSAYK